ncbi:MAG: T9SS type A sorting domain-containing protein [Ignavibacteriales bacterium]|nr:T9SS type A sorting domain-containing protein [Ignavibacteriales bacterium]
MPDRVTRFDMKNIYILLVFLILVALPLSAQNYFPLEKILRYRILTEATTWGPHGNQYYNYFYRDFFSLPEVTVNGKKFYKYTVYNRTHYYHFDVPAQILYIYNSDSNAVYKAFDFNLHLNEQDTTYFLGTPRAYQCTKIDTLPIWGNVRPRKGFTIPGGYGELIDFMVDFGITYHEYSYIFSAGSTEYKSTLNGLVTDNATYNSFLVRLDSTNLMKDRYIDMFPFAFKVYGVIANTLSMTSFNAEFKIIRNDTLIFSNVYTLNPITFSTNTNITPAILAPGDIIKYRVNFKDSSIFLNNVSYPDTGYKSIRVLALPSGTDENVLTAEDFILFNPYPNPFNNSATVEIYVPEFSKLELKLYDVIGNEVMELFSGEKPEGFYSFGVNAESFSSGVYFLKLLTGRNALYKKLILLK